jgi:hypothetical protein
MHQTCGGLADRHAQERPAGRAPVSLAALHAGCLWAWPDGGGAFKSQNAPTSRGAQATDPLLDLQTADAVLRQLEGGVGGPPSAMNIAMARWRWCPDGT